MKPKFLTIGGADPGCAETILGREWKFVGGFTDRFDLNIPGIIENTFASPKNIEVPFADVVWARPRYGTYRGTLEGMIKVAVRSHAAVIVFDMICHNPRSKYKHEMFLAESRADAEGYLCDTLDINAASLGSPIDEKRTLFIFTKKGSRTPFRIPMVVHDPAAKDERMADYIDTKAGCFKPKADRDRGLGKIRPVVRTGTQSIRSLEDKAPKVRVTSFWRLLTPQGQRFVSAEELARMKGIPERVLDRLPVDHRAAVARVAEAPDGRIVQYIQKLISAWIAQQS